jgi:NADPH-dependent 2,4-dienoyl-CoA reductase/sulfur reductase-like enzyme
MRTTALYSANVLQIKGGYLVTVPKKILVVGGSAAGPKAASKARRMDEQAEITLIQREPHLSMASCGYPYYVGGTFDDRNLLLCTPAGVVRDPNFFKGAKNIEALTSSEALHIDRKAKTVTYKDLETGIHYDRAYHKLVLATGAIPKCPAIPGVDLEGVTTLHSLEDADELRAIRDEKGIHRAVIVGAGLIGFEVCEALRLAGIEITVVEHMPQVLPFLDAELAHLVENHVRTQGADVITGNGVAAFLGEDGKLTGVKLTNGTELPCQLAVVAVGVQPNTILAQQAGLEVGNWAASWSINTCRPPTRTSTQWAIAWSAPR